MTPENFWATRARRSASRDNYHSAAFAAYLTSSPHEARIVPLARAAAIDSLIEREKGW